MLYSFSGTGTGSVNGAGFTETPFSIQLLTENVVYTNGIYFGEAASTALEIAGFGSGTFTKQTRIFLNTFGAVMGLSNSATGGDLMNVQTEFFRGYNMKRNLGPEIVGPAYLTLFRNYSSTLGNFSLTKATDITFTATVVPEPSCGVLAVPAFLTGLRRRRH
ncbi:MAG: hypothetical protein V4726_00020 [Verrucomicrobiota bacterium]